MESTSYVLSFRMVFSYLVTTGRIFYISLYENSINQSINTCSCSCCSCSSHSSVLVANPKNTLYGGQSRPSWSAEQGNYPERKNVPWYDLFFTHKDETTRYKESHRFSVCGLNLWIRVNAREVVASFARRHLYALFGLRSVLGHSAWLLASLVGTYGVFVPRSVLGHSA